MLLKRKAESIRIIIEIPLVQKMNKHHKCNLGPFGFEELKL